MITRDEHEFLTAREAARLLRVSHGKVLAWIRAGALPAANVNNGNVPQFRVSRDALSEFLSERLRASTRKE